MSCSSGCLTQDHKSWGDCIRAKRLRVGQVDATAQRKWDKELGLYESARAQGIQPAGTTTQRVREALELSDTFNRPFNAEDPLGSTVGRDIVEMG